MPHIRGRGVGTGHVTAIRRGGTRYRLVEWNMAALDLEAALMSRRGQTTAASL